MALLKLLKMIVLSYTLIIIYNDLLINLIHTDYEAETSFLFF
jgi:hypothetical protein